MTLLNAMVKTIEEHAGDTVKALAQLQLDHEQLISQRERDMTGGFTPMFLDAQGGFQWLDQVPSVA